jgi:hypothetical protein
MKKLIFINFPEYASQNEIEKLRNFYTNQGFDIIDPESIKSDIMMLSPNTSHNEKRKELITALAVKLSACDAIILAKNWRGDMLCNYIMKVADILSIPVYVEFTDKLIQYTSVINTKINGTKKDDYILTSETEYHFIES